MKIVLATINARYSHTSLGLRYLRANLGDRGRDTTIREFTLEDMPLDIVERILRLEPDLVGLGVYIWNLARLTQVAALLATLRPGLVLVIGGPEVSHEHEGLEIFGYADHLVAGEGELTFRNLVEGLESGLEVPKVLEASPPDLERLTLPYGEYTDADLRQRIVYVEASRGCPFRCEFCLSSLSRMVRTFPLEPFLESLSKLISRGARAFKFVDRTFNLDVARATAILEFCRRSCPEGFELHMEVVPERLPAEVRALLPGFPPGMVQFEVGVQTLTEEVARRMSRPLHVERIEETLRFLRDETGVHVHADLVFGLPGETLETFASSFDRLLEMGPDEIQVGILKRLRGAPIARHERPFAIKFNPHPPYDVLATGTVPFVDVQRMKRFARYFDLYYNSGNFQDTCQRLFAQRASPFCAFLELSDWLHAKTGRVHRFSLTGLCREVFSYLVEVQACSRETIAEALLIDYDRHLVRRERLEFLRPYVASIAPRERQEGGHGRRRAGVRPRRPG